MGTLISSNAVTDSSRRAPPFMGGLLPMVCQIFGTQFLFGQACPKIQKVVFPLIPVDQTTPQINQKVGLTQWLEWGARADGSEPEHARIGRQDRHCAASLAAACCCGAVPLSSRHDCRV